MEGCEQVVAACGFWDNSVRCYNVEEGRLLQAPRLHKDIVTCLATAADGSVLVSGVCSMRCLGPVGALPAVPPASWQMRSGITNPQAALSKRASLQMACWEAVHACGPSRHGSLRSTASSDTTSISTCVWTCAWTTVPGSGSASSGAPSARLAVLKAHSPLLCFSRHLRPCSMFQYLVTVAVDSMSFDDGKLLGVHAGSRDTTLLVWEGVVGYKAARGRLRTPAPELPLRPTPRHTLYAALPVHQCNELAREHMQCMPRLTLYAGPLGSPARTSSDPES